MSARRNATRIKALLLLTLFLGPVLVETVHQHVCTVHSPIAHHNSHSAAYIHLPYQSCSICDLVKLQPHDPYIPACISVSVVLLPVSRCFPELQETVAAASAAAYANRGPPYHICS
ncbi:hypothetical protein ECE50_004395 [Chitinophaga sp. Mgbs1]|uniref:Uncharacterized protein n=1 Tax=Chitinophaga solisilvae TaxID=1233460 RepID=A0A3S1B4Y0_9BACT|nr:hypothetical protein [Chitinophaga solisilvae]